MLYLHRRQEVTAMRGGLYSQIPRNRRHAGLREGATGRWTVRRQKERRETVGKSLCWDFQRRVEDEQA